MFAAIASILAQDEKINLEITGVGKDGRMKIVVKPQVAKGGNIALAQPLALAATPEELEAGFINVLSTYASERTSLQEQVQVTATIIAAAKQNEAGRATKALQPKGKPSDMSPKPSGSSGSEDDEVLDDGDAAQGHGDGDAAGTKTTGTQTKSGDANDDLLALI